VKILVWARAKIFA